MVILDISFLLYVTNCTRVMRNQLRLKFVWKIESGYDCHLPYALNMGVKYILRMLLL